MRWIDAEFPYLDVRAVCVLLGQRDLVGAGTRKRRNGAAPSG
jgi:hypothetical protein